MSSAASVSVRPCSRTSDFQVEKAIACPRAARVRRRAAPRRLRPAMSVSPRGFEVAAEQRRTAPGRAARWARRGRGCRASARFGGRRHRARRGRRAAGRRGSRSPTSWIGRGRVRGRPVGAAGVEERGLVGEVAVDGRAADAGMRRDGADRCPGGADGPVERHGAFGDAQARLLLRLGAALHAVGAGLVGHRCLSEY